MSVIRSKDYDESERRLAQDPIVRDMAEGLRGVKRLDMTHDDGTPRFEFMQAANKEYRDRGGKDGAHIGCIAHALLMILDESK